MLGTSAFEYFLISITIWGFRAVTPLSICYCCARPFFPPFRFLPLLDVWPIAEGTFYIFVFQPWRYRLQRRAKHPALLPPKERSLLYDRCRQNIPDPEAYLSKWFLGAPMEEIKKENVKEFYRWAFLNTDAVYPADEEELDGYAEGFEKLLGRKLAPGRGNARCLRLSLEEVTMVHRPLAWYLIVFGVDNHTHLSMWWRGFQYYRTKLTLFPTIFPLRPQTVLTPHRSPAPSLPYWYRPHRSQTKLPILFLHGIGIGLYPYVPFLAALNGTGPQSHADRDGDVGIIAIEILPVSFRMTHPALDRQEMCSQIQTIMLRHGFEKFVLVSHSYGSVITTHLLKDPEIAPQIASVVLIDPVSILLHLPDVAYNFTHRQPRLANEWQLWFFASKDMNVAHTLYRCFFWSENILWLEDFGDRKVSVFLSGRDLIVNTKEVAKYLLNARARPVQYEDEEFRETLPSATVPDGQTGASGVKLFFAEELDHAQIFDNKVRRDRLAREVLDISRR
ncbi:MAG: hypothetical protein M4579_005771 [Chaenotheca gracillima]|nr:MAG: hypothetical protein M4579_005771 [Chaenotheca gracillima]